MTDARSAETKLLSKKDWILIWCWIIYGVLVGPFLISADDSILLFVGFAILIALIYFTQRRVVPIIKGKIK